MNLCLFYFFIIFKNVCVTVTQLYILRRSRRSTLWHLAHFPRHCTALCLILYVEYFISISVIFLHLHSLALPHIHSLLLYLFIYNYKELLIPLIIIFHKLAIEFYIYENIQRKYRFPQLLLSVL